jgi:hypothetical protein
VTLLTAGATGTGLLTTVSMIFLKKFKITKLPDKGVYTVATIIAQAETWLIFQSDYYILLSIIVELNP